MFVRKVLSKVRTIPAITPSSTALLKKSLVFAPIKASSVVCLPQRAFHTSQQMRACWGGNWDEGPDWQWMRKQRYFEENLCAGRATLSLILKEPKLDETSRASIETYIKNLETNREHRLNIKYYTERCENLPRDIYEVNDLVDLLKNILAEGVNSKNRVRIDSHLNKQREHRLLEQKEHIAHLEDVVKNTTDMLEKTKSELAEQIKKIRKSRCQFN